MLTPGHAAAKTAAQRAVEIASGLLIPHTGYLNSGLTSSLGFERPSQISCTQLIAWVAKVLSNTLMADSDLNKVGLGTTHVLFQQQRVNTEAIVGDVVLYEAEQDLSLGYPKARHVMLIANDQDVLGACPVYDRVVQVARSDYLARLSLAQKPWTEVGVIRPQWQSVEHFTHQEVQW
jgi:hypothetical protein